MNPPETQRDLHPEEQRPGATAAFDRLFAEASPLIRAGRHHRETPPVQGGRWPLSVVLRPAPAVAEKLEQVMSAAEVYAGREHFRTGIAASVHFTVRVLERYREVVGESDELVARYTRALREAARRVIPIELDLVGLTLAPGSVMVAAVPVHSSGAALMDLLGAELGEDGWREAGLVRQIWYANVLHFAAEIAQPDELITWVAQRRQLSLGRAVLGTAELMRFRYENGPCGRLMRPQVLASAALGASGEPDRRNSSGQRS
jgi:hypothetical protein